MLKEDKPVLSLWKPILKYAAIFIGLFAVTYFFNIPDSSMVNDIVAPAPITLKIGNENIRILKQVGNQQIVSTRGKVLGVQQGSQQPRGNHTRHSERNNFRISRQASEHSNLDY